MSLYDQLGVSENADRATIKRAYRSRAQKAHPDKGGDPRAFHAIQRAYDVLSDDARRATYDRTGADGSAVDENAQLLNALAMMVLSAIDAADPDTTNLLEVVRGQLKQGRAGVEQARRQNEAKIKKRERALKRLQKKGGGENLIAQLIEGDIAGCRRAIEMAKAECAKFDRMLGLVDEYTYQGTFRTPHGFAPIAGMRIWS